MILLHNHTGCVLSKRGLKLLLEHLDMLEDQMTLEQLGQPAKWRKGIEVRGVECIDKTKINVRVNRHGMTELL